MTNKEGEVYESNQGYKITIISFKDFKNCTIQFSDSFNTIKHNVNYYNIKNGRVSNPNHKSVLGVGFLGQGVFKTRINNTYTLHYRRWRHILNRVYSKNKSKTYENVKLCEEWLNFQNFAKWFEENYNPKIMEGWHLDKDILVKNNKIYSSKTCCFVPPEINSLMVKSHRNNLPPGVRKKGKKFQARIKHKGFEKSLGIFSTKEEAFNIYKIEKEKIIKSIANKWKNKIQKQVYNSLMNWQVEIND